MHDAGPAPRLGRQALGDRAPGRRIGGGEAVGKAQVDLIAGAGDARSDRGDDAIGDAYPALGAAALAVFVRNADGRESWRAEVNNMYGTAENGGANPLVANRAAIGAWERFDLVTP